MKNNESTNNKKSSANRIVNNIRSYDKNNRNLENAINYIDPGRLSAYLNSITLAVKNIRKGSIKDLSKYVILASNRKIQKITYKTLEVIAKDILNIIKGYGYLREYKKVHVIDFQSLNKLTSKVIREHLNKKLTYEDKITVYYYILALIASVDGNTIFTDLVNKDIWIILDPSLINYILEEMNKYINQPINKINTSLIKENVIRDLGSQSLYNGVAIARTISHELIHAVQQEHNKNILGKIIKFPEMEITNLIEEYYRLGIAHEYYAELLGNLLTIKYYNYDESVIFSFFRLRVQEFSFYLKRQVNEYNRVLINIKNNLNSLSQKDISYLKLYSSYINNIYSIIRMNGYIKADDDTLKIVNSFFNDLYERKIRNIDMFENIIKENFQRMISIK